MDVRIILLVSALLLSTLLVDARRPPSNRRRGSRVTANRYSWTRELENGNSVNEEASVPVASNQIYVKSIDDRLADYGFKKAALLYYFSGTTPIVSLTLYDQQRVLPCFILDTTLTYNEVITTLTQRNTTTVGPSSEVSLDGSGPALSRTASREFAHSNPSIRRVCKGRRIVRTSTTASGSENTEVVKVLTLDSVLNLTIQGAGNSTRPARRGNRRGGHSRG